MGLAAANGVRGHGLATVVLALGAATACACADEPIARVGLLSVALLLGGWWWGSARPVPHRQSPEREHDELLVALSRFSRAYGGHI